MLARARAGHHIVGSSGLCFALHGKKYQLLILKEMSGNALIHNYAKPAAFNLDGMPCLCQQKMGG